MGVSDLPRWQAGRGAGTGGLGGRGRAEERWRAPRRRSGIHWEERVRPNAVAGASRRRGRGRTCWRPRPRRPPVPRRRPRCPSSVPPTWTATIGGSGRRAAGPAGPLAPNTIVPPTVSSIAPRQGVRSGWLGVNPASSATPPRVPTPDISPPAPHELAKLFALATETDVDLADYILLAAATGARRSELIALRWADLDIQGLGVDRTRIVLGFNGLGEKDTKTHAARLVRPRPDHGSGDGRL